MCRLGSFWKKVSFQLGTDCEWRGYLREGLPFIIDDKERRTEVCNKNTFLCWWDCIIMKRAKKYKFLPLANSIFRQIFGFIFNLLQSIKHLIHISIPLLYRIHQNQLSQTHLNQSEYRGRSNLFCIR